MDAEADIKLECPGANALALVTQGLLFSALVCPSGCGKRGEAEEQCCLEKSLADLACTPPKS